ncbi:hypothetical protein SUGI_0854860 [Cryptomeria japonica]|uniref:heavy metal-associated isoprenylated plant protein 39 n=1 Tax=Cryptomeria japonica TaxID=3369 RepID=UPI002414AA60|nr:heavy metal-associated isoprenylated plant protein 39 [Cryptomeria japonica]GLJ41297.1 hypothetical protein SUGI_0854860 [Cryptomeria japonica]
MSKKIVLKVNIDCEKCKRKVMKTVAGMEGVDSVQVDSKDGKITVIGDADPVSIINKLRKFGRSDLLSVGPAKEPEKKPAEKKDEKKDDKKDDKKDEKKKDEKKDEKKDDKKKDEKPNPVPNITYVYLPGHSEPYRGYSTYFSEENPNSCCIS